MEKDTRTTTTAVRLKEAMRLKGKKQVDLIKETGIERSAISRYVAGQYEPKQAAINKLARALNVSEMWLWGYDVPMERTDAQKKNDALSELVVQLRSKDAEFLGVVSALASLPDEQYESVKTIISSLSK